jgi:hypothetical protein
MGESIGCLSKGGVTIGTIDPGFVRLDQLDICQNTHVGNKREIETRRDQADLGVFTSFVVPIVEKNKGFLN